MKDITLAFSELAGRLGLEVSSKDNPQTMADSIVGAFEETKPLELSEREKTLSLSFREAKIDRLRQDGVSPAITNRLTSLYCSDALALSNDDFELILDLIGDLWQQKVKLVAEKTKKQQTEPPKTADQSWAERTKNLKPA